MRLRSTIIACLLTATPISFAAAQYSNDLTARQKSSVRKFWIANSVPAECQRAIYEAALAWNASGVNATLVWSGYVDDYAYYKNTVDGKFYEWVGHNTPDTWSQGSYIDDPAIWGYHFPKYDESLTNWSANPPKVAVDGDTAINLNRMPEFHCNYTTNPPSDKRDMQSHGVHEYGHVWGLGHDSQDTTGVTAMYRLGLKDLPGLHRRPEPRDVGRAKFIYGSK